jgi:hypothetical protein
MKTTTIPVATFNDVEPAQQVLQRLQQVGLPAILDDESKLERFGFMTPALAAIHIEVPTENYLDARRVIDELDRSEDLLKSAVRCPECRSSRIEFPQLTRKFILPSLLRFFMALKLVPRSFYCMDCHYTWPMEVPVEPERDILGFPRKREVKKTRVRKPA